MSSDLDPSNPFAAPSTLPYGLPDFGAIREDVAVDAEQAAERRLEAGDGCVAAEHRALGAERVEAVKDDRREAFLRPVVIVGDGIGYLDEDIGAGGKKRQPGAPCPHAFLAAVRRAAAMVQHEGRGLEIARQLRLRDGVAFPEKYRFNAKEKPALARCERRMSLAVRRATLRLGNPPGR